MALCEPHIKKRSHKWDFLLSFASYCIEIIVNIIVQVVGMVNFMFQNIVVQCLGGGEKESPPPSETGSVMKSCLPVPGVCTSRIKYNSSFWGRILFKVENHIVSSKTPIPSRSPFPQTLNTGHKNVMGSKHIYEGHGESVCMEELNILHP